ncbi:IQ domain-containing protein K-like [Dendronephthya gigantea]|uniref:IQ domain-containing protein K-like n=1 Tax=Dendronephthya gigantea TaxID=151771 RepID=UPI00106BE9A9|nr:IQ domain-containing protein K-like [Dendronephthya gigantea]
MAGQDLLIFDGNSEINRVKSTTIRQTSYQNISLNDYDSAKSTPVFYGSFPRRITEISGGDNEHMSNASQMRLNLANMDEENCDKKETVSKFDAAIAHPATFGYVLLDKVPVVEESVKCECPTPDPLKCTPREYCEYYIFPILLPALEEMLIEAKANKVFEKRRTKFNACDFLTSYLFSHNPKYNDREGIALEKIPFVQEILAVSPRPPIPLSLLLSDDEAATIIQAFYKGYKVRKEPDVQELRQYQREMREEECEINFRVEDFWRKHSIHKDC